MATDQLYYSEHLCRLLCTPPSAKLGNVITIVQSHYTALYRIHAAKSLTGESFDHSNLRAVHQNFPRFTFALYSSHW